MGEISCKSKEIPPLSGSSFCECKINKKLLGNYVGFLARYIP
jgi:hypothetical protein